MISRSCGTKEELKNMKWKHRMKKITGKGGKKLEIRETEATERNTLKVLPVVGSWRPPKSDSPTPLHPCPATVATILKKALPYLAKLQKVWQGILDWIFFQMLKAATEGLESDLARTLREFFKPFPHRVLFHYLLSRYSKSKSLLIQSAQVSTKFPTTTVGKEKLTSPTHISI